ncbi:exopolysaccharide biosynthesis protein [Jannaschia donghaensis]|uniref:Exopolysaccharide synthesis, ExoD n=1 Tax=Jannaschia donghaensis TaxID=420998 RepID=A0A0M6YLH0_9RHOB|nr:exopolysaccharide biosynthesis protein [Jannaschia donghaensis]CTQ50363.1 Exopolysaccharide synthesis, ExoD [Jannaschia donghaensis]
MRGAAPQTRAVSSILKDLSARNGERADVRLADVAALLGSRVHGAAILILALPETIPAPVPGLSSLLGVPLLIVSLHLAIFGERGGLPARVAGMPVPGRLLSVLARYGSPVLRRIEAVSYPRLARVVRRERAIGWLCAFWSLVLWFPIPFLNGPPATLLVLLSWGLVQRDGAVILVGAAGSIALIVITVFLGDIAVDILRSLIATDG